MLQPQSSQVRALWTELLPPLAFHEPSLEAIFLFPVNATEQSHKQFEDNQTAVCSKLSHGLFFILVSACCRDIWRYWSQETRSLVLSHTEKHPSPTVQFSTQPCCGFDQIPRQTNPSRSQQGGHWGVGTHKIASHREQKALHQLLAPQPLTVHPNPGSSAWSWGPSFTCT